MFSDFDCLAVRCRVPPVGLWEGSLLPGRTVFRIVGRIFLKTNFPDHSLIGRINLGEFTGIIRWKAYFSKKRFDNTGLLPD
ncbi:hypothetical protein CRP01_39145 [Flavilitoribacter nigricans DSM 23189 = NBRC 102662]|uniref:Uncharacterized protein n=1 Tax=Flavilitoribacter nigricans (strain ATCC 23147 / DSM 23189 / NBRC 102662 / NCIMB 1420 / SS-2) TaxID=1122177 RepID=A0A2D0MXN4_FLAN2|nr:hypothetical protein CRP01_39145 [Flavilitoribacter nigricans DSM 23189 = NBRC 102662]